MTRWIFVMATALIVAGAAIVGPAVSSSRAMTNAQATPAAQGTPVVSEDDETQFRDFATILAENLDIEDVAVVDAAIRTTLDQMVDERLAAGILTERQAAMLKRRIDAGGPLLFPRWGDDGHHSRGEARRGRNTNAPAGATPPADAP